MLPDHNRSHPYQTPASVSVTITIGTTIQRFPALWYVVAILLGHHELQPSRPAHSGALDQIFEQIDAGEVPLGGDDGLLTGMLKAALERGLEVELTDHVGYERGDPGASLFPNSRNGTTAKTVASQVGDVELAIPRDRNGTFTPRLVPKGSRRLGGLDEMIISL